MTFSIRKNNDRLGIAAFCDVCGKHVVDDECNVLSPREIADGAIAPVKIACKIRCTDIIDPDSEFANQELGACVLQIVANSKVDLEAERQTWRSFELADG